jgi:hypothetical protein
MQGMEALGVVIEALETIVRVALVLDAVGLADLDAVSFGALCGLCRVFSSRHSLT